MNMLPAVPAADAALISRIPAWLTGTIADAPRLVWSIDATSGRAMSRWLMLPREGDAPRAGG